MDLNMAHFHLLLNHVPVIGTYLAIALLGYGVASNKSEITRASLGLFVLMGLAAFGVFLTGEPAEHAVEGVAGVSEGLIEGHEEAALLSTILLGVFAGLSLGGILFYRRSAGGIPRRFAVMALVLSAVPALSLAWTANRGGLIRHSELRTDAPVEATADVEEESER
jgi:hypothetical protein